MLVSHVLVPPTMRALLESPANRVQAFLGPGHVCTVMGQGEYEPIAREYRVPIVITGFEPVDLLEGLLLLGAAARRRPGRGREPLCPGRSSRGQPGFAAIDRRRVRGLRPQVARHRPDPSEWSATATRITLRSTPNGCSTWATSHTIESTRLHQRPDPARAQEALRLPGLRPGMHSAKPSGRDDGLVRGRCAAYYAYGRHLEPAGTA